MEEKGWLTKERTYNVYTHKNSVRRCLVEGKEHYEAYFIITYQLCLRLILYIIPTEIY